MKTSRHYTLTALLLGSVSAALHADILYVANSDNNTIVKFSASGAVSGFASGLGDTPFGLAFDSAGNLYVGNLDDTIERITPGGVRSVFASSGLSVPTGLAFDGLGNLYVANERTSTIEKFTPSGV